VCSMFLIVVCWIMDEVLDVWTDDDDDVICYTTGLVVFYLLSH
jgi:hypothetical protein